MRGRNSAERDPFCNPGNMMIWSGGDQMLIPGNWTPNERGLREDCLTVHTKEPFVQNGKVVYQRKPGEILYPPRYLGKIIVVDLDVSGRGKDIEAHHLYPEVSGWRVGVAKLLERFDKSRFGRWYYGDKNSG